MQIVFQIHHADASDAVQQKAARALQKLSRRLRGTVEATVRLADDGGLQRAELSLRAPRRPALIAVGTSRRLDVALTIALTALERQIAHVRAAHARRLRRLLQGRSAGVPVAAATDGAPGA